MDSSAQNLRLVSLAACGLILFVLGGCATVLNVKGQYVPPPPPGQSSIKQTGHIEAPKRIYGGVAMDALFGSGMIVNEYDVEWWAVPVGLYTLAIDMPLSAVGDTLTLPVTVPATYRRWTAESRESEDSEEQRGEMQQTGQGGRAGSADSIE